MGLVNLMFVSTQSASQSCRSTATFVQPYTIQQQQEDIMQTSKDGGRGSKLAGSFQNLAIFPVNYGSGNISPRGKDTDFKGRCFKKH